MNGLQPYELQQERADTYMADRGRFLTPKTGLKWDLRLLIDAIIARRHYRQLHQLQTGANEW
jgi:hypothetical protein